MKNILVGIEFEEQSMQILERAQELAKSFKAKLWLIHIAAPDPEFIGYEGGPSSVRNQRAAELRAEHRMLQKLGERLKSEGLQAECLLVQGPTDDTLLEEAQKIKADLLVVGHHKSNWLYRFFVGSNAEDLLRKAKLPIMAVPIEL